MICLLNIMWGWKTIIPHGWNLPEGHIITGVGRWDLLRWRRHGSVVQPPLTTMGIQCPSWFIWTRGSSHKCGRDGQHDMQTVPSGRQPVAGGIQMQDDRGGANVSRETKKRGLSAGTVGRRWRKGCWNPIGWWIMGRQRRTSVVGPTQPR